MTRHKFAKREAEMPFTMTMLFAPSSVRIVDALVMNFAAFKSGGCFCISVATDRAFVKSMILLRMIKSMILLRMIKERMSAAHDQNISSNMCRHPKSKQTDECPNYRTFMAIDLDDGHDAGFSCRNFVFGFSRCHRRRFDQIG
jgi:hypothetical protein